MLSGLFAKFPGVAKIFGIEPIATNNDAVLTAISATDVVSMPERDLAQGVADLPTAIGEPALPRFSSAPIVARTDSLRGSEMMKPVLKEIYNLDQYEPLEGFYPDDESNFGISVRLMIGPENGPGSESFDILVCTPDWLKMKYAEEKMVWGRHMLIVLSYDFNLIKQKIEKEISRCTGDDWATVSEKLSRMGAWEFEDYRPKE